MTRELQSLNKPSLESLICEHKECRGRAVPAHDVWADKDGFKYYLCGMHSEQEGGILIKRGWTWAAIPASQRLSTTIQMEETK